MALKSVVTLAALIGGGLALANLSMAPRRPSRGAAAGSPMAASGAGDDLFGSDSQAGESARTPGLADFTRGA